MSTATTDEHFLEVSHVDAGYGKSQILFDISLRVPKGKIIGLIGPNGSGKSTVLKSIFGLTTIYGGSVRFNGKEVAHMKPHEVARSRIVYLPQTENTYLRLTVLENLTMAGYELPKQKLDNRVNEVLEIFPFLKQYLKRKALILSGGQRQMLAMASALIREPTLMMLDEPGTNLSPKLEDMIFTKIKELNVNLGQTMFVVEQDVEKLLEICEKVYILGAGRIRHQFSSDEFAKAENRFELFLGVK